MHFVEVFYVMMAVGGIFRGLHSFTLFACCLQLTSPTQSVLTFMVECALDGVGALAFPYIAGKCSCNEVSCNTYHVN